MSKRLKLAMLMAFMLVVMCLLPTGVFGSEEYIKLDLSQTKSYYKVGDSVNGTGQVQVSGLSSDGLTANLTGDSGLSYTFSNPDALTVSDAGVITAVGAGGGVLTVSMGDISARMYLGAYTGVAQIDSGEGNYPPTSEQVIKTDTVSRSGQYAIQLKNGGKWPKYNDNYDSAVSETWFYDDGESEDTFFVYFQSTGNDTTYTPRYDGPSTAQYFVGYNSDISTAHYYFKSYSGQRTIEKTGQDDTDMKVDSTATSVPRSQGWHQVTCVVNAGNEIFDKLGTVELYLDGNLIFTENYTHRFMGVLRPEGQGEQGGIFDDLIYYTSGNNIPQTAPEARNLSVDGRLEERFTVTANYTYYDKNGDYEKPISGTSIGASPIEWQISNNGMDGWTTLSPAAQGNKTYDLTADERGKYIRFVVTPTSSDQNYAVANTARTGTPTASDAYYVAPPENYVSLDISTTKTTYRRGETGEVMAMGVKNDGTRSDIRSMSGLSYQSSDPSVALVSSDGDIVALRSGVTKITASVSNVDGTKLTSEVMVVCCEGIVKSTSFETGSTASNEQVRTGSYSKKQTGNINSDFYADAFAKDGVLEGWFYDDGQATDKEIYFQSGARGNTIPVSAMYHIGVKQSVSTDHYYVRNNKNGRVAAGGTGGVDEYATDINRTVGWHQVLMVYEKGYQTYSNSGNVKIYLDGKEILSENYSHDNMQVIRATTKSDSTTAYYDDFVFYNFDDDSLQYNTETAEISINPVDSDGNPLDSLQVGSIFTANIDLTNITSKLFFAAQVSVYYDPSVLQVVNASGNPVSTSAGFVSSPLLQGDDSQFQTIQAKVDAEKGLAGYTLAMRVGANAKNGYSVPEGNLNICGIRFKVLQAGDPKLMFAVKNQSPQYDEVTSDGYSVVIGNGISQIINKTGTIYTEGYIPSNGLPQETDSSSSELLTPLANTYIEDIATSKKIDARMYVTSKPASGTEIYTERPNGGDTVKAKYVVKNNDTTARTVRPMLFVYKDKALVTVIKDNKEISAGGTDTFELSYQVPTETSYRYTVKATLWYGAITPVAGVIALNTESGDPFGNDPGLAADVEMTKPVKGTIAVSDDVDWLRFTADESYLYNISSSGNVNVTAELYNAAKAKIADCVKSGNNFSLKYGLTAGETYYLKITGVRASTTLYTLSFNKVADAVANEFSDYPNIPQLNAASGDNYDEAINYPGDSDIYRIYAAVGGSYFIGTSGGTTTNGVLYGEDYEQIQQDGGTGTNGNFKIMAELQEGRYYYVRVAHKTDGQTGVYRVHAEPQLDVSLVVE